MVAHGIATHRLLDHFVRRKVDSVRRTCTVVNVCLAWFLSVRGVAPAPTTTLDTPRHSDM